MKRAQTFTLKISRYNPEQDKQQTYSEYTLELGKGMTLADALLEIKEKHEPSLAFRNGCSSGICGTCAVKVNGNSFLLCRTKVAELLEKFKTKKLTIEPLTEKVIRDLVVDDSDFWHKIKKAKPWLITKENGTEGENIVLPEQLERFAKSEDCICCMACDSDCEVCQHDKKFLGPAALVKTHRFVFDSRDRSKARLKQAVKYGLWKCSHSYACIEQCPAGVEPGYRISELREESVRQGIKHPGQRHAQEFLDSLKSYGNLDEKALIRKTAGFGGIRLLRKALAMALHGKFKDVRPRKIKDILELRKLVTEEKK